MGKITEEKIKKNLRKIKTIKKRNATKVKKLILKYSGVDYDDLY